MFFLRSRREPKCYLCYMNSNVHPRLRIVLSLVFISVFVYFIPLLLLCLAKKMYRLLINLFHLTNILNHLFLLHRVGVFCELLFIINLHIRNIIYVYELVLLTFNTMIPISLYTFRYRTMHKVRSSMMTTLLSCLLVSAASAQIVAPTQVGGVTVRKSLNYRQPTTPFTLDNYLYSTFYAADKRCYNLKGLLIGHTSMKVASLKANPAGVAYAVLTSNGKKSHVEIFDAYRVDQRLFELASDDQHPTAIAYSADSKRFFMALDNKELKVYDGKSYVVQRNFAMPIVPTMLEVSANDYYLALAGGMQVVVVAQETGQARVTLPCSAEVKCVAFSDDSSMLGVLTSSGFTIYDTRSFTKQIDVPLTGTPTSFAFHPEGKYVGVVSADQTMTFVNLMDVNDCFTMNESDGHVSYLRFVKDGKKNIFLSYNTLNAIRYKLLGGFSPNYTKLLKEELLQRMEEWSKMREGETLEAYKERVNEESRLKQARLFEQEIATKMADNRVMNANVTLGGYNPQNNLLALNFDNMPTIYLTVPEGEVQDFMTADNLEFRDAVYGITKDDKFELIYANVYNKATGKQYEFNNLSRQSLDFMSADDSFVPIELVQQSSMEEVQLNTIKHHVVENARKQNLISDHTNIQVSTGVVADYDATGNRITNYKVGFNYTVDAQYSAHEDFAAGRYKISESNAAKSMLKIVAQAFEKDFAQYIKAGKKVVINITGSADALPINGAIAYDGSWGDIANEPYYLDNELSTMTITRQEGIRRNEQLAFVRAVAVKDYIEYTLTQFNTMNTDYKYHINLSDKTGGAYRRISVEFTFINAFDK